MNAKKVACGCSLAAVVTGTAAIVATALIYYFIGYRSNLPEERPIDLNVDVYEGGGMEDVSSNYSIYVGQGYYDFNYGNADVTASFTPTHVELDQLWATIRSARFDKIQTYEEEAYDRGGTTISVSYGDEYYSVSNSGSSFLSGSNTPRFYQVANGVYDLAHSYLDTQKQTVTFELNQSLADSLTYAYVNNTLLYIAPNIGSTPQGQFPTTVQLLPGDYEVALTTDLGTTEPPDMIASNYVVLPLTITTATTVELGGTAASPTVQVK